MTNTQDGIVTIPLTQNQFDSIISSAKPKTTEVPAGKITDTHNHEYVSYYITKDLWLKEKNSYHKFWLTIVPIWAMHTWIAQTINGFVGDLSPHHPEHLIMY